MSNCINNSPEKIIQNTGIEAFEAKLKRTGKIIYEMLANGKLTPEDVMWYQSFSGYRSLCSLSCKDEMTAEVIRRYIFTKKLNGREEPSGQEGSRFCLPDGSSYASLTDPALLDQMVNVIRQGYQKCKLLRDEGVAERIPQTPSALRTFLVEEISDRNRLLRLLFVLKPEADEFDYLLTTKLFANKLSVAVPRELVIRYCLETKRYDWSYVNELLKKAENYQRVLEQESAVRQKEVHFTGDIEWPMPLGDMPEETFLKIALYPCCEEAIQKSPNRTAKGTRLQYSLSKLEKMWEKSILYEAENMNANAPTEYKGPYSASTIFRYCKELNIPDDYPLLSDERRPEKIMSRENYCRLFSYRIAATGKGSRHSIYSMEYGQLPTRIHQSILMYSDIEHLPSRYDPIANTLAHNVKRYMILLVVFMKLLLEHWQNHDFLAHSQEEADALWQNYFRQIRQDLQQIGVASFARRNPLDAMLCLCLRMINPLECYNRIYELDVLQSFARNESSDTKQRYPSPDRIRRVLDSLDACASKLKEIDPEYFESCQEFRQSVEKKLPAKS